MELSSVLNIIYFVVVMLGMIAGIGLAAILALAVKKVKNGMWIGLCAVGMVLMVIDHIAMIALQLAGEGFSFSLSGILWDLVSVASYLCAAGFMMLVFGKKRPAAVLLLVPVVLYLAAVNIDGMISNIRYGMGIMDSFGMMLRSGAADLIWFAGLILLVIWYLTGRKTAIGVFAVLLAVIALIMGLLRGARIGVSIWLGEYGIDTLRDLTDWSTAKMALDQTGWKTLLFVFLTGWSGSHCILTVQVIQAFLLSFKVGQQSVKKIPAAAAPAAPAKPVQRSKFCIHCGSSLPEGSRFCMKCGKKIG